MPFNKYITKITIKSEEKVELPEYISLATTPWGDLHIFGDVNERLFVIPSSQLRSMGITEDEPTEEQTEAIRQRIMEVIRSARWA